MKDRRGRKTRKRRRSVRGRRKKDKEKEKEKEKDGQDEDKGNPFFLSISFFFSCGLSHLCAQLAHALVVVVVDMMPHSDGAR